MDTHLIMPMAGAGSRFFRNGYMMPKPLIDLYGKPFFFWAVQSVKKNIKLKSLTFVVLQEHIDKFGIDREIKKYFPEARITALPEVTEGATVTCLKGLEGIHDDNPVVFNDCDHCFASAGLDAFLGMTPIDADGGLLTFKSTEDCFSYIKYDDDGRIIGTIEKEVVSDDAIAGAYVFRNADVFRHNAERYMRNCGYREFFVSGVYNELCNNGGTIKSLQTDWHLPFGIPEEYEAVIRGGHEKKFESLL